MSFRRLLPVLPVLPVLLCVAAPAAWGAGDPFEPVNRLTFGFNQRLDRWILAPLARGYRAITPSIARQGVGNFFGNLGDVPTAGNQFLQGKFRNGASDFGRVLLNTTVGLGGLFDVASGAGLAKHQEDLGQTFAVWGVGSGPYLVLPLVGPSNFRDTVGGVGEGWVDPLRHLPEPAVRNSLYGLRVVHFRYQALGVEQLTGSGGDPYSFVKDAWEVRREDMIRDGAGGDPFLDEDW